MARKHPATPFASPPVWVPALAPRLRPSTSMKPDRHRCNIRDLVRHGDPAEEIVALASEEAFDLLVIGAPHRRFFEGLVLGTTTLRAVRHAPCPVLTVSGPGEVR